MKQYKLPLLDGREIAFNSISAEEADKYYQAIISQQTTPELEEYIFNSVTDGKYAEELDTLDAGIILTVVYSAFSLSGVLTDIKDFPDLIEKARESINNNAYNILYTTIIKGISSYTPDVLKQKPLNELLDLFAMAETIIGQQTIDIKKLREILGAPVGRKAASGKYKDREGKGASLINEDQLKSLTQTLNFIEEGDFDETGKYIGDGNLL